MSLVMTMPPHARTVAPWAAGPAGGGADLEDQPWAGEAPTQNLVIDDRQGFGQHGDHQHGIAFRLRRRCQRLSLRLSTPLWVTQHKMRKTPNIEPGVEADFETVGC